VVKHLPKIPTKPGGRRSAISELRNHLVPRREYFANIDRIEDFLDYNEGVPTLLFWMSGPGSRSQIWETDVEDEGE
jgi:hypothetical protein